MRLKMLILNDRPREAAEAKVGRDEKIACKYLRLGNLPNQAELLRSWSTKIDPFKGALKRSEALFRIRP